MNINLHIERLILDNVGIEPHQKCELKAAVQSELQQNLASQGVGSTMQSTSNRKVVKGGSISMENIHKPARLGQQIGDAIYRGVGK